MKENVAQRQRERPITSFFAPQNNKNSKVQRGRAASANGAGGGGSTTTAVAKTSTTATTVEMEGGPAGVLLGPSADTTAAETELRTNPRPRSSLRRAVEGLELPPFMPPREQIVPNDGVAKEGGDEQAPDATSTAAAAATNGPLTCDEEALSHRDGNSAINSSSSNVNVPDATPSTAIAPTSEEECLLERVPKSEPVIRDDDTMNHGASHRTDRKSSLAPSAKRRRREDRPTSDDDLVRQFRGETTQTLPRIVSRNVAHRLLDRATYAAGGRRRPPPPMEPPLAWRSTPWIHLDTGAPPHSTLGVPGSAGSTSSCRLAWDAPGVLLAASSPRDQWIRIYDWDVVRSADRQGRSHLARHRARAGASAVPAGVFAVEPILSFPVRTTGTGRPRTVTCLEWNPYRLDELVVGTNDGEAVVCDLGAELVGGVPPHRVYACSDRARTAATARVTALTFGRDGRHLLVGCGTQLRCFDVATHRTVWEWTCSGGTVTALEPVPRTDLLVVGSSLGHFMVLDSSKCHRRAFSHTSSPALVRSWISHQGLSSPSESNMGIRHLSVQRPVTHHDPGAPQLPPLDVMGLTVTWVTSCGWVLRSWLDLDPSPVQRRRATTAVWHATRPVEFFTAEGERVSNKKHQAATGAWSLPPGSSVAAGGAPSGHLVWERVPDVIQFLAPADQRVISSLPRLVRDTSAPALWFLPPDFASSSALPTPQGIRLSKRWDAPLAVSVHPNQDWIVVATRTGIYTLAPRGVASSTTSKSQRRK